MIDLQTKARKFVTEFALIINHMIHSCLFNAKKHCKNEVNLTMKVLKPLLWDRAAEIDFSSNKLELAAIIPRAGQRRRIYLNKYEKITDGQQISCLWTPPASELNGWDFQPSEVTLSYIITGIAHLKDDYADHSYAGTVDYFEDIKRTSLVVDIDVDTANTLIDTSAAIKPDFEFDLATYGNYIGATATTIPLWLESGYASYANVAGYTYLHTRTGETVLEAILHVADEQMTIAYHSYSPPIGGDTFVLNNILTKEEQSLFENILSTADPIEDNQEPYLI